MELDIHRWCVWSDNINIAAFLWEILTPTLPNFLCTTPTPLTDSPPPSFRRGDSGALPSISMRKKVGREKKRRSQNREMGGCGIRSLFMRIQHEEGGTGRRCFIVIIFFWLYFFFSEKWTSFLSTKFGLVLFGQTVAFVGNRGRQRRQSFFLPESFFLKRKFLLEKFEETSSN